MPVISVTLLPGYPADVETRLVGRLATAARSVIAASPAGTTVFVNHANTYQRDGNVFSSGGPARPVASDVVKGFLEAMQQRDLNTAQSFLAAGFAMRFPGSAVMHSLAEMINWARPRYRSVAKDYERFEEVWRENDTVVFCSGTLHGTWNDGRDFSGIRFIDRFEVVDGKITRQDVWNDVAETLAAQA
ncbi:MAG: nuclear transport factor 2 family protein [Pseudomonadota bacterium]